MQVRKVTPPRRRTSDESWSVYKCRPGCLGCNTKLLGILLIVIAIAYRLQVIASTVVSLIPARGGTLSDWQWEVPIVTNLDADTVLPTTAAPVLPGESFPCSDDTFQKYMDPPIARIHCLGETFNETRPDTPAALYRSCHYDNMCYHVQEKRLVLFPSPHHWTLLSKLHANIHLSSVSKPVMASAVRRLITDPTAQVTPQYYPTNVNYNNIQNKSSDYYVRTDTKVVLVPIQPESCQSILWDVYLPVYTLLEQFDLQHKPYRLLLLGEAANAHCTRHQLDAFAAMMGFNASDIVSFHGTTTQNYNNTGRKDNNNGMIVEDDGPQFVCYHRSVMGMGRLGDYEMIRPENYSKRHVPPAHIGRQSNFRGFRKHWLQRMGLPHTTMITPGSEGGTKPFRVVYSTSAVASNDWKPLSTNVPGLEFVPWNPEKDRSSLREQIQWMNKTAILILSSDQDKTVAFFLPEGATLILLGDAPVDWDLWNNNALLRVHLVRDSTQETVDCLIRDELSRLEDNNDPPNTAKAEHRADFDQNNRSIALIYGKPPISRIHCVGEKQFPDRNAASWYRSCYFKNLCFDLSTKSFVVFPSPTTLVLMKSASRHNYYSSIPSMLVASPQPSKLVGGYLSGIPQIHSAENVSSYYYLEGAWLATMTFNSGNMGKHTLLSYSSFLLHLGANSVFFRPSAMGCVVTNLHPLGDVWINAGQTFRQSSTVNVRCSKGAQANRTTFWISSSHYTERIFAKCFGRQIQVRLRQSWG